METKGVQSKRTQIKTTLNIKIILNVKEKYPAQHYLYFECTFGKWKYFYLNGLIVTGQKIMLISQNELF